MNTLASLLAGGVLAILCSQEEQFDILTLGDAWQRDSVQEELNGGDLPFLLDTSYKTTEPQSTVELLTYERPEPDSPLFILETASHTVVTILWNGNVEYDTNNVTQATCDFWNMLSRTYPNIRKQIAVDYLKEKLEFK